MLVEVKMPQLGETVADGTVTTWFKRPGDVVTKGDVLFEVSTDKVDTEIPAQATGTLSRILVNEGQTVDVGTVLALIATGDEEHSDTADDPGASRQVAPSPASDTSVSETAAPANHGDRRQLSPVVRTLLREHGIDVNDVVGTGPNGRVTKEDVLSHTAAASTTVPTTLSPVVRRLLEEHGVDAASVASSSGGRLARRDVESYIAERTARASPTSSEVEVVPFTRIRKLTAEHTVRSKATSAHTLMVREVDYEVVERFRRRFGAEFKEREGFSLTYLPFISVAAMAALHDFPFLNASVGDDELIVHRAINLGIAVDLDNEGLVVPVIPRASERTLLDLARSIHEVATRARNSSLGVDDYAGGTFTITNPGPFGTLMTGAVINQPQVAILASDAVSRRPVVVSNVAGDESIAIHSSGLLSLTFDHRAVDGAYAARFLQRVAMLLDEHDWASTTEYPG